VTFLYLISPELIQNMTLMLSLMVLLFWLITAANCFGMKVSGLVSTIGVIMSIAMSNVRKLLRLKLPANGVTLPGGT